ncbi:hypothetical protein EJB05_39591, partial [Eragrostis curvula]
MFHQAVPALKRKRRKRTSAYGTDLLSSATRRDNAEGSVACIDAGRHEHGEQRPAHPWRRRRKARAWSRARRSAGQGCRAAATSTGAPSPEQRRRSAATSTGVPSPEQGRRSVHRRAEQGHVDREAREAGDGGAGAGARGRRQRRSRGARGGGGQRMEDAIPDTVAVSLDELVGSLPVADRQSFMHCTSLTGTAVRLLESN